MAGTAKTGKSAKIGTKRNRCARYRQRELESKTAKTRRVLRALLSGVNQPGWKLKEDRKHVFRGR